MGIRVDVLPLDVNTPGHGVLRITGWEGSSEGLQCSLQSSQTQEFLHEGGRWGNVAHWFQLDGMSAAEGGAIETRIGPNLINPLLQASGTANFRIEVNQPATGQTEVHMVRLNPTLIASADLGPAMPPEPAAPVIAAAPAPEPVIQPVPAPVVEPEPQPAPEPAPHAVAEPEIVPERILPPPPPPPKPTRWLIPVLILVLLALIAAGAAWWWFNKKDKTAPDVPPPVAEAPAPAPAPAATPCTLESMQNQPELAFVQACIQNKPDSATVLEVIKQAKANKHCGVAQRLYANRAQGGDIEIASAYAREYDPKYLQPSECFKTPDNATAAYWYETILGFDENNAEAKARFEELKP